MPEHEISGENLSAEQRTNNFVEGLKKLATEIAIGVPYVMAMNLTEIVILKALEIDSPSIAILTAVNLMISMDSRKKIIRNLFKKNHEQNSSYAG